MQVEKSFGTGYKQSAVESSTTESANSDMEDDTFVQWVADNVNHNEVTLTGKGTFHGMGVISASTFQMIKDVPVQRLSERKKTSDFVKKRGIPIVQYPGKSRDGLLKLKMQPIEQLTLLSTPSYPPEVNYTLLWRYSWFFRQSNRNWSGFMQNITQGSSTQRKDQISFAPIIDLNPSDENCIYSTLLYICDQANKLRVEVPSVTFDQPLCQKSVGIIEEAKLEIVCRLGGFHMMMSFLGSIGNLMKGSSIEDLLIEVYAENTVSHIMSGKAVSRALRAHFLTEAVLVSLLFEHVFDDNKIESQHFNEHVTEALHHDDTGNKDTFLETKLCRYVSDKLENLKITLSGESWTAKL